MWGGDFVLQLFGKMRFRLWHSRNTSAAREKKILALLLRHHREKLFSVYYRRRFG
jgi:hypothetical protein